MEPVSQGELLVEDCPQEDVLSRIRIRPVRILVPIDLESAPAAVLRYASGAALKFGSELVLFYAFDDPECRHASRVEKQLWKYLSAVRTRHPTARLFVRAGVVGDEVKAVAASVGAGLIVMSRDYYHRFLSWMVREEAGLLTIQGMPCPVALVDAPDAATDGAGGEASIVPAFGGSPGTSIMLTEQSPEHPPAMVRYAVWSLSARSRLRDRDARTRLNRGRFRGRHCMHNG
ncbi:MAG: universal stress protein [Verrucomicrobia bacterium]|nr:universal stress protein [Verrucomicrobiota bacterium]